MSFLSRSRANSDILPDNRSGWISDAFHPYRIPSHLAHDGSDPVNGHTYQAHTRFLGLSSLRAGPHYLPCAAFYEITVPETEDGCGAETLYHAEMTVSNVGDILKNCATHPMADNSLTTHLPIQHSPMTAVANRGRSYNGKSRRSVIFCLETDDMSCLFPARSYFLFPQDAVVEVINTEAPYKVLVSFHPPTPGLFSAGQVSDHPGSYKSKLDEFAAVCSSSSYQPRVPHRRLTDPGQPPAGLQPKNHVMSLQMAGVPAELYLTIKRTVSQFELTYQRMIELMRSHTVRVASQRVKATSLDDETIAMPLTKPEFQSNDGECYKGRVAPGPRSEHRWSCSSSSSSCGSNEDATWDKSTHNNVSDYDIHQQPPPHEQQQQPMPQMVNENKANRTANASVHTKKCLYCGSKSTPMWRRGPQGAGTLCNACGVKWKHGKILSGSDMPGAVAKEPRPAKAEKKRKRTSNLSSRPEKRQSIKTNKKKLQVNSYTQHEEDGLDIGRHSKPSHGDGTRTYNERSAWENIPSSSQSISDSFSPNESFPSSPSSSPPLPMMGQVKPRHSIDMTMVEKIDISDAYTMSVGVDAVEAAAVLTLLKRS